MEFLTMAKYAMMIVCFYSTITGLVADMIISYGADRLIQALI